MFGGYALFLSTYVARLLSSSFRSLLFTKMTGSSSKKQKIEFAQDDDYPRHEVTSREVEILTSGGSSAHCSSWIKANNIVDYVWEERFYTGQLLAVHRDGNYIAYGIKGKAKSQCHIRVMNCSNGRRALMRDSEHAVEDLALAHTVSKPGDTSLLLAVIDIYGSLLVYHINETDAAIECSLILHVFEEETIQTQLPCKVFWCPYIPTDETEFEEYVADLLAVARGPVIEVWHVELVAKKNEKRTIRRKDGVVNVSEGFVSIKAHTARITEAVFSPDGTAIATASADGSCKFYQVYMISDEDGSRCLHEWRPHDGSPVTLLAFLDDHKTYNPDIQFWKYAVTGTSDNCELRLWSCETWHCLQAITFSSISREHCRFKIALDLSSKFLVANCVDNKTMYVLELQRNSTDAPYVSAVSELRLSYSILSFGVVGANRLTEDASANIAPSSLVDVDLTAEEAVSIKMFIVQPKSLQSCDIKYPVSKRKAEPLEYSGKELLLTNGDGDQTPVRLSPRELSPETETPLLMTPAAFAFLPAVSSQTSTSLVTSSTTATPPPTPPPAMVCGLTSGNSSPSREVQQILRITPEVVHTPASATPEPPLIPSSLPAPPPSAVTPQPMRTPSPSQVAKRSVERKNPYVTQLENEIATMKADLATLVSLLKRQTDELQELRGTLSANQSIQIEQMSTLVDRAVTKAVSSALPSAVLKAVTSQLPHLTKKQIVGVLNPAVEEMKENFSTDMNRHLVASDAKLRDAINKLVRCSPMVKQVGASIVEVSKPAMEEIVKTCITEALPKVDKACQLLFLQLSSSFSAGTAEYVGQVESQVDRSINQCQGALSEAVSKFEDATKNFLDTAIPKLETCVAEAVMRLNLPQSRAVTPFVKVVDKAAVQERMLSAANQGNYNSAFQEALTAGDLSIVTYLCEKIPVERVFGGEQSLLNQPVLLSLIQQLSADMYSHSLTRHKYLEEAVLKIDVNCPVTREHIPIVLHGLMKQLDRYLLSKPAGSLSTRVNVLRMATQVVLGRINTPNAH